MVKLKKWNGRRSVLEYNGQRYDGKVVRLDENHSRKYYFRSDEGNYIPVGGRSRRLIRTEGGLALRVL